MKKLHLLPVYVPDMKKLCICSLSIFLVISKTWAAFLMIFVNLASVSHQAAWSWSISLWWRCRQDKVKVKGLTFGFLICAQYLSTELPAVHTANQIMTILIWPHQTVNQSRTFYFIYFVLLWKSNWKILESCSRCPASAAVILNYNKTSSLPFYLSFISYRGHHNELPQVMMSFLMSKIFIFLFNLLQ